MKERLIGHATCMLAYTVFGFNIIVCKNLTGNESISPLAIFTIRSVGAGGLFWLLSLVTPRERVARGDYWRILLASFLGYFLTQITFLIGIHDITPMDCSILGSLSPIYTMFIAAVALREPLSWRKCGGVAMSFAGIFYLIVTAVHGDTGAVTKPSGVLLMLANGLSFALYLGIFKPVIQRYSVVTFMKWIFLFAFLMSAPFTASELMSLDYGSLPASYLLELGYLVVMATFVAYFLIPLGQKRLRPTLVSMYSYLQPLIAIAVSIWIGMDTLTLPKALAAAIVFAGVILVSLSRSRAPQIPAAESETL